MAEVMTMIIFGFSFFKKKASVAPGLEVRDVIVCVCVCVRVFHIINSNMKLLK